MTARSSRRAAHQPGRHHAGMHDVGHHAGPGQSSARSRTSRSSPPVSTGCRPAPCSSRAPARDWPGRSSRGPRSRSPRSRSADGAPACSAGRSSCISTKGARWFTASTISCPSAVRSRRARNTPALLTRSARRGCRVSDLARRRPGARHRGQVGQHQLGRAHAARSSPAPPRRAPDPAPSARPGGRRGPGLARSIGRSRWSRR